MKFQKPIMHGSKVMLCIFSRYLSYKVKMLRFSTGQISRKPFQMFSIVNQIIYLASPISLSGFKAMASIVFEIS